MPQPFPGMTNPGRCGRATLPSSQSSRKREIFAPDWSLPQDIQMPSTLCSHCLEEEVPSLPVHDPSVAFPVTAFRATACPLVSQVRRLPLDPAWWSATASSVVMVPFASKIVHDCFDYRAVSFSSSKWSLLPIIRTDAPESTFNSLSLSMADSCPGDSSCTSL